MAKCRRAAPPPGPPPPIPRSLLLEKQQQQFQHQQPDGATSNVYFSFPPTAHPSQQHSQHIISPNNPTLICYPNTAACHTTPDISNEVEAIATPEYRTTANPNNTLPQIQHLPTQQQVPHVRRRKTPPCAMYPSGGGESGTAEADLVEVVQRPQQSSQQHNYPAFSSKKRLALSAASATVSRNRFSSSSSSMWLQHGGQGMKREPTKGTHGYNETKWWKADGNNSRTSHLQVSFQTYIGDNCTLVGKRGLNGYVYSLIISKNCVFALFFSWHFYSFYQYNFSLIDRLQRSSPTSYA